MSLSDEVKYLEALNAWVRYACGNDYFDTKNNIVDYGGEGHFQKLGCGTSRVKI